MRARGADISSKDLSHIEDDIPTSIRNYLEDDGPHILSLGVLGDLLIFRLRSCPPLQNIWLGYS